MIILRAFSIIVVNRVQLTVSLCTPFYLMIRFCCQYNILIGNTRSDNKISNVNVTCSIWMSVG